MPTSAVPLRGTLTSTSPAATRAIGHALGDVATPGTLIALIGPLGAGKTQLTKGLAEGLGVTSMVNSPTFVLMNEHVGRLRLFHVDAYRLDDPEDLLAVGLLDDRAADGVTVVEWADRLAGWLPDERLEIDLQPGTADEATRSLRWQAIGTEHHRLAELALAPLGPRP